MRRTRSCHRVVGQDFSSASSVLLRRNGTAGHSAKDAVPVPHGDPRPHSAHLCPGEPPQGGPAPRGVDVRHLLGGAARHVVGGRGGAQRVERLHRPARRACREPGTEAAARRRADRDAVGAGARRSRAQPRGAAAAAQPRAAGDDGGGGDRRDAAVADTRFPHRHDRQGHSRRPAPGHGRDCAARRGRPSHRAGGALGQSAAAGRSQRGGGRDHRAVARSGRGAGDRRRTAAHGLCVGSRRRRGRRRGRDLGHRRHLSEGFRHRLVQQLAQRPLRPRGQQHLAHAWPAPRVLRQPPQPAAHLRGEDAFRARGREGPSE